MPLLGYFVTREMGFAKIYRYTKFKVSIHPFQIYGRWFKIQESVVREKERK